ncbi:MAG: nucleoside hydrolase [Bacteroidales bacterium]|nr:nucleoside hydrolase [Bacteroidales bacterium]
MKIFVLAIFCVFSYLSQAFPHSGKPRYHLIIDTDGAIDDMRAITMLLSANDIRVLAITCSEGSLKSDGVFVKVRSLLSTLHHEGIRLGISENTHFITPVWASFAQSVSWGREMNNSGNIPMSNSTDLLDQVTVNYNDKITLIALGSLKTYADWIQSNPSAINKIERIIWYNDHNIREGFNYQVSPPGYDFIRGSGIKLEIVSAATNNLKVNQSYLDELQRCNSPYARQIIKVHQQKAVAEKIEKDSLYLWDDMVPLYLAVPFLFDVETADHIKYVTPLRDIPENIITEIITRLLESSNQTDNKVFTAFPVDSGFYKPGYARIVNSTIENYGLTEWKAIALTNEIHGHTGIYSIIGAKMGIRAMEYFNVGINNLNVTTFAGNTPPLSCLNDGVQISTGSTIGQGLIIISDSISNIPSAEFEFNHQKVMISLKEPIAVQMQNEIRDGVKKYGLLTDQYWLYIEDLALKYWAEFDRHEIFTIKTIK